MKRVNIESLFSALNDSALTVCAVTRDYVAGFTTTAAKCAWSDNDLIISAAESRSYIAIDKAELLYIEKTVCLDSIEYEIHTTGSNITLDIFKKAGV